MKLIQSDKTAPGKDEPLFMLRGGAKYSAIGLHAVADAMQKDGVDAAVVRTVREHALEMDGFPTETDEDGAPVLNVLVPDEPDIKRPAEKHGRMEKAK